MFRKQFIALAAAAAVIAAPASRATADTGDFAAGVVTGIIGTIIVGQGQRRTKPPVTSTTTYVNKPPTYIVAETPQRSANRVTQTALNYFGFDAGYADGIYGPRTEGAVSAYQAYMGFPVEGKLTSAEREILVSAYERGESGDQAALQLVSTSPEGTRALLWAEQDRLTGMTSSTTVVTAGNTTSVINTAPAPVTATTEGAQPLPILPVPTSGTSVAAFCDAIEVDGARVTPVSMTEPEPALNQAFCEARAESIAKADLMASGLQTVPIHEIETQCRQFGPVLSGYVASLSTKDRTEVLADVGNFVTQSGADRAQLASTARICLGTGYRLEDMNVAVGAGLLLAALGESAYGELAGHHLLHGFGVAPDQDRAIDWLIWSTDEIAAGATPVFGDPLRVELVDEAVYRLNGGAPTIKTFDSKGKLPVFETQN